jgi:hypothetical protein
MTVPRFERRDMITITELLGMEDDEQYFMLENTPLITGCTRGGFYSGIEGTALRINEIKTSNKHYIAQSNGEPVPEDLKRIRSAAPAPPAHL